MATLLVELLTEELPPKALSTLGLSFATAVRDELVQLGLADQSCSYEKDLATPRRLAVLAQNVLDQASSEEREITGPSTSAPPAAVAGFAKKHGIATEALARRSTTKGEVFVARIKTGGASLERVLAEVVERAVRKLPIPKVMRWGDGDAQFVRPVHGLVMLHGSRTVPGTVLGLASSNRTQGHRFMGKRDIVLASADEYVAKLRDEGMVICRFAARKAQIEKELHARSRELNAALGPQEEVRPLLEEVSALVEHPTVYVGSFDPQFLEVPQECLILTMRQNQKYFPLFDVSGRLQPKFLIVSNMRVADARHIVGGNERVVRPRLEDARFFYLQDRKTRLEARVPELARVVYHSKLGTQLERVQRIKELSERIAEELASDVEAAGRAAWLAKADLLTGMVGEFPELQGIMGRYYALHDGEPREVADAIEAHYRPRFAGDRLPEHPVSCAVALADKFDALRGLFGIGQVPTGDKDPFGLRRAAVGVIRILAEQRLALRLRNYVDNPALEAFIYERARGYFQEQGYSANEVEAVLSLRPERLDLVPRQLEAVRAFAGLPEAQSLAAANKRIGNILKQAGTVRPAYDAELLLLPEEKTLAAAFKLLQGGVEQAYRDLDYTRALKALATLKGPVDAFFDKVMVMDKDSRVRDNRIGFLGTLHGTMNRIADLSKLAT